MGYILLSLSLIGYNLATDSYEQRSWYEYVLQGGGGECVDSVILVIQLAVLRLELRKEQPYTAYHVAYFVYLAAISGVRLALTLVDVMRGENDTANLVIACLFVADSGLQLAYWLRKRQSLPQFEQPQRPSLSYHPSSRTFLPFHGHFAFISPSVSL